jgi:MerR family copper efflux transcriptional regulator
MHATLTVGALARRANVSAKTVRYYEAIGLLSPAVRGENGYRYYPREAVNRMSFIRRAKLLGLTLDEIGSLMELSDEGMCDVISPELHRVLERKIAECDRQLAEIAAFRETLAAAAERLDPCATGSTVDTCGLCSAFAPECGCLPAAVEIGLPPTA